MKATMKPFALHPMRLLAGACVVIALLALASAAVAQQTVPARGGKVSAATTAAQSAKPKAKAAAEEESPAPNSANHQGIKVHGHWVLQLKNADGTLGERREFDNSLVTGATLETVSGNQVLALLISGNGVVGDPAIAFIPNGVTITDPTMPCSNEGSATQCFGFTTTKSPVLNGSNTVGQMAANMPVTNPLTASQTGLGITVSVGSNINWVLSGNYVVPSGLTSIATVETILPVCMSGSNVGVNTDLNLGDPAVWGSHGNRGANLAPASCDNTVGNAIYGTLTATAVPGGPMSVSAGQVVAVLVTITFS